MLVTLTEMGEIYIFLVGNTTSFTELFEKGLKGILVKRAAVRALKHVNSKLQSINGEQDSSQFSS